MLDKTTILYIPGYGGSNTSNTFMHLKTQLIQHDVYCLKYDNTNPVLAQQQLDAQIKQHIANNTDVVFVGSSLGGYWANAMAKNYKFPCFLINPSLYPMDSLGKYGVAQDYLHQYLPSTKLLVSRTIILGIKDDVVDHTKTIAFFENKCRIVLLDQGHRLTDFTVVLAEIKYFLNNVQEL
jgi:uncharacterized protein